MTDDEKTQIIEHFAASLKGRFGALKPTWAMASCAAYIADLRAAHLSWEELEELFNEALKKEGREAVATGSVARLYHRALKGAGAQPSAVQQPVLEPEPPLHPSDPRTDLVEHLSESEGAVQIEPKPAHESKETGSMVDHLSRVHKRAQDKKRLDEA